MDRINNHDTICAPATPAGGALGIIRVAGPKAIEAVNRIFRPAKGTQLAGRKGGFATFGTIIDDENIVDEVIATPFRAPHSYTGEDSVEISCHGSSYIISEILRLLITKGDCRMAEPGEYTKRAFLNGKMDLSQAEAVADVIASTSKAAHNVAIKQMRGGFSRKLKELREKLLRLTSLMELELDFSDHEELEFADRSELKALCNEIENELSGLCRSFSLGNAMKNGIPVAIAGETNTGKSTLLNLMLNDEKAIVSDIDGTTRDIIEDTANISGVMFRFIDTAGIRETNDKIESIGIEKTFKAIGQASIVLLMLDASIAMFQWSKLSDKLLPLCHDKHLIVVFNKCDLIDESHEPLLKQLLPDQMDSVFISAKEKKNIDKLQKLLVKASSIDKADNEDVIITNLRHLDALRHASDSIRRVSQGLSTGTPTDLVAQDLRECIYHLSDIAGEVTTDAVLKTIFEHFCVGK